MILREDRDMQYGISGTNYEIRDKKFIISSLMRRVSAPAVGRG